MINGFLYEYCNIIRNTKTVNANSEEVVTPTTIYSNVQCYVNESSGKLSPGLSNGEEIKEKAYISIDRGYTIQEGDIVEVIDRAKYIVEKLKEFNLISMGNIRMTCKRI